MSNGYRMIAIGVSVVALMLAGLGYYVYTQYRDSRVDVIGTMARETYLYDEVVVPRISDLPAAEKARYSTQLRAAVASVAPNIRITDELLFLEESTEWEQRVRKISAMNFQRFGFTESVDSGATFDGASGDYGLWEPDGVVRRMFDDRTLAAVAITADLPSGKKGFLLGYFELRPVA